MASKAGTAHNMGVAAPLPFQRLLHPLQRLEWPNRVMAKEMASHEEDLV